MSYKKSILAISILMIFIFVGNGVEADRCFTDIYGHWASNYIIWGTNEVKLFKGYQDGTFRPESYMTRSEYISILYRTARRQGIIQDSESSNEISFQSLPNIGEFLDGDIINSRLPYTDVEENFWAYKDIKGLFDYVNNLNRDIDFKDVFPGNKLKPNQNITREEATLLTYFFTSPSIEQKKMDFKDIDKNYPYYKQIQLLVNNNIITGYTDNTFGLKNGIKRGEVAVLIKKIYFNMALTSKSYLSDLRLIDNSLNYKYILFGNYSNRNQTSNDAIYRRAISTLEYTDIVKTIPYEERHLYDNNPIETLKKLKQSNYWNQIGVNYYLIKYGKFNETEREYLYNEILESYLSRNDINSIESFLIFNETYLSIKNEKIIIEALDKWYNGEEDFKMKLNSVFLKCKIYLANGKASTALKVFDTHVKIDNKSTLDIDVESTVYFNRAYILLKLNKYEEAQSTLQKGWEKIKLNRHYLQYRSKYDDMFEGAIKEILTLKSY